MYSRSHYWSKVEQYAETRLQEVCLAGSDLFGEQEYTEGSKPDDSTSTKAIPTLHGDDVNGLF